jgi:hypothetical protein
VTTWRRRILLALAALSLSGAAGCATGNGMIALRLPAPPPRPGPADSPRLQVQQLVDFRDPDLPSTQSGLFVDTLIDGTLEEALTLSVTQAVADRLSACGRFREVATAPWLDPSDFPLPPAWPTPPELVLEGEVATFYSHRSTIKQPFLSLLAAPLSLPLAALSGLRLVPSPLTPLLPVVYRANLTLQLRLREGATGAVFWEKTVEGIAEQEETAGIEFFESTQGRLQSIALAAIQRAVEQVVASLPPADPLRPRAGERRQRLR